MPSGLGALWGLSSLAAARMQRQEKRRIPRMGFGYLKGCGMEEMGGGGGKKESVRALTFSSFVDASEGVPFVVVLRVGTRVLEKSEGLLVTYLLAVYICWGEMFSSQSIQ